MLTMHFTISLSLSQYGQKKKRMEKWKIECQEMICPNSTFALISYSRMQKMCSSHGEKPAFLQLSAHTMYEESRQSPKNSTLSTVMCDYCYFWSVFKIHSSPIWHQQLRHRTSQISPACNETCQLRKLTKHFECHLGLVSYLFLLYSLPSGCLLPFFMLHSFTYLSLDLCLVSTYCFSTQQLNRLIIHKITKIIIPLKN